MNISRASRCHPPFLAIIITTTTNHHFLCSPRNNFTGTKTGTEAACEAGCNSEPSCLGFTRVPTVGNNDTSSCWTYDSAPALIDAIGDYFQKPGTPPIPAPPPLPPAPPAPTPLACTPWADSQSWQSAGCSTSTCVLITEVTAATGVRASVNVVPFVAPKAMQLPPTAVTATIDGDDKGLTRAGGGDQINITVAANATAMFVVLTTRAAGRFSENAFHVEGGHAKVVSFISWSSAGLDAEQLALLRSSLRVEHLQGNLLG